MRKLIYTFLFAAAFASSVQAGNPDRQGEAGYVQLLINPWARSAGLHGMTVSNCRGVESMHINPAGGSRFTGTTELNVSHTRYFEGAGIGITSFGLAQKLGKRGALMVGVMSLSLGDIPVTTEATPEGTGATFSPSIVNINVGYSHSFENKVSVGAVFRGVSESTRDASSFSLVIDAGVQYVAGKDDNFKFGIALRNVGSRGQFSGQGLSIQGGNPGDGGYSYKWNTNKATQSYEAPSSLSIGSSYDFLLGKKNRFTVLGQFTSNSFSRDNIGGGVEFSLANMFALRGGYRYEVGVSPTSAQAPIMTGVSGGFSVDLPLRKDSNARLGIDYAYQQTKLWSGNHVISVRMGF
jgi:hypothetical protein